MDDGMTGVLTWLLYLIIFGICCGIVRDLFRIGSAIRADIKDARKR